jgi:hypothetical protein
MFWLILVRFGPVVVRIKEASGEGSVADISQQICYKCVIIAFGL